MPPSGITVDETDQAYWSFRWRTFGWWLGSDFQGGGHIRFHRTGLAGYPLSPLLFSVTAFTRFSL